MFVYFKEIFGDRGNLNCSPLKLGGLIFFLQTLLFIVISANLLLNSQNTLHIKSSVSQYIKLEHLFYVKNISKSFTYDANVQPFFTCWTTNIFRLILWFLRVLLIDIYIKQ